MYWSATNPRPDMTAGAWGVDFSNGMSFGPLSWRAPAVASAPGNRYEIGPDTVYDSRTLLTWERGTKPAVTLAQLPQACAQGFRVPSIEELQTLIDVASTQSIDALAFPDAVGDFYWSSTPVVGMDVTRWGGYFGGGMTLPGSESPPCVACVDAMRRSVSA